MCKTKAFCLLALCLMMLAGCGTEDQFTPPENGGYFTGTVTEDFGGGYLLKAEEPGNTAISKGDLVAVNWKPGGEARFQPGDLLWVEFDDSWPLGYPWFVETATAVARMSKK